MSLQTPRPALWPTLWPALWPTLWPTQPPIQLVLGTRPAARRPRRDDDCTPPSSAEVKNAWSYTPTPWRAQGQFYLHLYVGNDGRITTLSSGCLATDCPSCGHKWHFCQTFLRLVSLVRQQRGRAAIGWPGVAWGLRNSPWSKRIAISPGTKRAQRQTLNKSRRFGSKGYSRTCCKFGAH
jgi:hypothetical protein